MLDLWENLVRSRRMTSDHGIGASGIHALKGESTEVNPSDRTRCISTSDDGIMADQRQWNTMYREICICVYMYAQLSIKPGLHHAISA